MYEQGDASVRASRYVRKLGFSLPGEPEYNIPVLPSDITAVSDKELMELMTEISAWLDYTEVYFVSAQIDERQEQQKLDQIEALEHIRRKAEKTVTTIKAAVYESEEYVAQRDEVFLVYSRRKILEVVYNSLDRKKFLVSRELTRRKYGND
jgi:hypothetical protein